MFYVTPFYTFSTFSFLMVIFIRLADCVYPSVCTFQLKNCWTDFDEIWYVCCAITGYPKIMHFNFL
jgi:hypothetical protein